jgi:hypothetical protein
MGDNDTSTGEYSQRKVMENELPSIVGARTLSEAARLWILPEIQRRLDSGKMTTKDMPWEVSQFRFSQWQSEAGAESKVELNDEVQLVVKSAKKSERELQVGQAVCTSDIDLDQCFIEPPRENDRACSYFFACRSFLDWSMFFDFGPNLPQQFEGIGNAKLRFPLKDLLRQKQLTEKLNPVDKFDIMARENWPPSPGYFPGVMSEMDRLGAVDRNSLLTLACTHLNRDYWGHRLRVWTYYNLFQNRYLYAEKSVNHYLSGNWVESIYVLIPHFEGIIKDYLVSCGLTVESGSRRTVQQLKNLILSRPLLLYPRRVLETFITYLETGSFWQRTDGISDAKEQINRHGVLHGEFHSFESQEIALKYLALLDGLSLVLFHDMMVSRPI